MLFNVSPSPFTASLQASKLISLNSGQKVTTAELVNIMKNSDNGTTVESTPEFINDLLYLLEHELSSSFDRKYQEIFKQQEQEVAILKEKLNKNQQFYQQELDNEKIELEKLSKKIANLQGENLNLDSKPVYQDLISRETLIKKWTTIYQEPLHVDDNIFFEKLKEKYPKWYQARQNLVKNNLDNLGEESTHGISVSDFILNKNLMSKLEMYEQEELKDSQVIHNGESLKMVYFTGQIGITKNVKNMVDTSNNFGFDAEQNMDGNHRGMGSYKVIPGDQIVYRYEIVKYLSAGTYGKVVIVKDHKYKNLPLREGSDESPY